MDANEILVLLMFLSFAGLLLTGFPIAYTLAGLSVIFTGLGYLSDLYFDTFTGLDYLTLGLIVNRIYKIIDNWVLVALPMFIFMGMMLDRSGVAERMMLSTQKMFGKVRGGLALTVVFIGIVLAASTGIIGASVALLGLLSLPAMLRQKTDPQVALGTIASSGTLGILLPPSIMLVIMGDQLAVSVGDLFMGAVLPGLLIGGLYAIYLLALGYLKPDKLPIPDTQEHLNPRILLEFLKAAAPPLGLILLVLGSIFLGIATPTEASGLGAMSATLLAWANRKLNFTKLREAVFETFNTSAYIFMIFIGATCFALVVRELGGDELITTSIQNFNLDGMGTVLLILFIVFLLGFLLDWIEITLIILPLLAPIIVSTGLEIDGYGVIDNPELIWFILLVAVALQTSFLTPPVGFAIFYLKGVCPPEISLSQIYKGVIPFVFLQLIGLVVIILFPELVLWLPSVAFG